jgi:hypothetical protein
MVPLQQQLTDKKIPFQTLLGIPQHPILLDLTWADVQMIILHPTGWTEII